MAPDLKSEILLVRAVSCRSFLYAAISYPLVEGYSGRCLIGTVESVASGATSRSPAPSTLALPIALSVVPFHEAAKVRPRLSRPVSLALASGLACNSIAV